jgi:sigma-B regulation protein RsbQ
VGEYLRANLPGSTYRLLEAFGHCPHMTHPRETTALIREYVQRE